MCSRVKGFVRQLRLRFIKKPRETVRGCTDAEYTAKLRRLKAKKKRLEDLRRNK